jgi:hypothetical protein
VEPVISAGKGDFGTCVNRLVGIIDDQNVTTASGKGPTDGCRKPISTPGSLELGLSSLFRIQPGAWKYAPVERRFPSRLGSRAKTCARDLQNKLAQMILALGFWPNAHAGRQTEIMWDFSVRGD